MSARGVLAVLCSGQGSQSAGMFDLVRDVPEAAPAFAAARSALRGEDPRSFVQRVSPAVLETNVIAQILCCTQAMAAWQLLRSRLAPPVVVAGYSVGELAAWGVAGLVDTPRLLTLALERATAMSAATTEPSGLTAIHGLPRQVVDAICRTHGAYLAIINGADQFLVGGSRRALGAVARDAVAQGAHTTDLPVEVPSHTPLLARASAAFRRSLEEAPLPEHVPPGIRLLSGIDGTTVFDVASGAQKLALQIQETVDFAACLESCRAAGVSKVVELGPGNALVRLARERLPDIAAHSISEFHSPSGFQRWVLEGTSG